jgi:hypothetical protein
MNQQSIWFRSFASSRSAKCSWSMFSGNAFDVMAVSKIHFNFIYSKSRRELRLLPIAWRKAGTDALPLDPRTCPTNDEF